MEYQNENFGGQYDFRCNAHEGWHIQANLHEYSELLYCQTGSGTVTVNGKTVRLQAREMVWIPPNYIHQYDFHAARVICAVFSNDFIPLFFRELADRHFCVSPVPIGELSHVIEGFPRLKREMSLELCGYLNLICARVMARSTFETTGYTEGIIYQKVISYIAKHYTEDITLPQLAKEFGYNTKYLSHALHQLTGIHFRQLLNYYRINHAKKLLSDPKSRNIVTVAAESGFTALNTFNREFKKFTGVTPTRYKAQTGQ